MNQILETRTFPALAYPGNSTHVEYRGGTSDERVLKEVIDDHTYRKSKIGFDVQEGERWLDLGANIGAFAIYCWLRGATCQCLEPDPECFELLTKNVGNLKSLCRHGRPAPFSLHNSAVTHLKDEYVQMYRGKRDDDHYRYTVIKSTRPHARVHNIYASNLLYTNRPAAERWDGVKMDIEGAELELIDNKLIPRVKKLVMEYHLTKDNSMKNFRRRMEYLHGLFKIVSYIPSLDQPYANDIYPGFYDRLIFCKN